ncbi:MAG: CAP domain-containing protein [Lautropia sp.]
MSAALLAGCGGGGESAAAPSASAGSAGGAGGVSDLATSAVAAAGMDTGAGTGTAGATATLKTDAVLAQINAVRAAGRSCGAIVFASAGPLAANGEVETAADDHTDWMQANRTMSHTGAGGSSAGTRLTDAGYRWSGVGENVATGQSSAEAVIAAWLASPDHCANIMSATFVDVGFAFLPAAGGAGSYATMVLARPR